ncbi:hypothetical protein K505DRAFT_158587 [Melanomma pulvis-pyrius CBS 109.77]|uniref:Uncharacterized protein n=1 Tax=Melanomma pulvis-pyrius CBS 109.77 TaxID=1314802 RepID=A0A6A6XJJ9_9PLEO|nr:hypothetical protein K505DRAFT_158587 [Melanomma pulvis-pyrius CBS 109.77]
MTANVNACGGTSHAFDPPLPSPLIRRRQREAIHPSIQRRERGRQAAPPSEADSHTRSLALAASHSQHRTRNPTARAVFYPSSIHAHPFSPMVASTKSFQTARGIRASHRTLPIHQPPAPLPTARRCATLHCRPCTPVHIAAPNSLPPQLPRAHHGAPPRAYPGPATGGPIPVARRQGHDCLHARETPVGTRGESRMTRCLTVACLCLAYTPCRAGVRCAGWMPAWVRACVLLRVHLHTSSML